MIATAIHCDIPAVEIKQGLGSEVYYYTLRGQPYIFRRVPQNLFAQELRVLKTIAPYDIGPTLINHNPENSLFLFSYIPGNTLPLFSKPQWKNYCASVRQLRKLHEVPLSAGEKVHWPFAMIYEEYAQLQKKHIPYPSSLDLAIERIKTIEKSLSACPKKLCHNDFHRDNVILSPDGPKIIDFSTAALGDPYFDLAKFCISVPEVYRKTLLDRYHGRPSTQLEQAHYFLMEKVLLMVITMLRYSKTEGTTAEKLPPPKDFLNYPRSPDAFLTSSLKALHAFLLETHTKRFQSACSLCQSKRLVVRPRVCN